MEFRFVDPAKDFSDGMRVLYTYHDGLLDFGKRLLRLVEDISKHGINEARANECIHLHCYYTRATRLHHHDEEKALFPLILKKSFLIDGMLERLLLDHEEIEEAWNELARMLGRPEHICDKDQLFVLAGEFEKLQREHLLRENEDLFPKLKPLLDREQLAQMGKIMVRLRLPA